MMESQFWEKLQYTLSRLAGVGYRAQMKTLITRVDRVLTQRAVSEE